MGCHRRVVRLASTLILLLISGGCAAQHGVAPPSKASPAAPTTPVMAPASPPPPLGAAEPPAGRSVIVYYETDRKWVDGRFSGDKEPEGKAQFGSCVVKIPPRHQRGVLETPFMSILGTSNGFSITGLVPMSGDVWTAAVRNRMATAGSKDVFVFVHGCNVTFADACMRTAQLAFGLQFKGAPLMWSWPSQGKAELYLQDEDANLWTVAHLTAFLEKVAKDVRAESIHIIAHSMGSRAVTRALSSLTPITGGPRFREVILAAADIDRDNFLELADAMKQDAKRTTLYSSTHDKAINAAHKIHNDIRVGEGGEHVVIGP